MSAAPSLEERVSRLGRNVSLIHRQNRVAPHKPGWIDEGHRFLRTAPNLTK